MRFKQFNENSALEKAAQQIEKNFSDERKVVQDEVNKLVRMVEMGKGDKLKLARALTALTKAELQAKAEDPDLKYSVDQNIGMMKRAMDMLKDDILPANTSATQGKMMGSNADQVKANESIDEFDFFDDNINSIEDLENWNWDSVSDEEIKDLLGYAEMMYAEQYGNDDDNIKGYWTDASNFLENLLAQRQGNVSESLEALTEAEFDEAAGEKDACYRKVKSRYKVWPSAYASGALVKCRKVGAANWGNKGKK